MTNPNNAGNAGRESLRHALATLAYRGGKVVRDAPPAFASFTLGSGARTPLAILAHMGDLLQWALNLSRGDSTWPDHAPESWEGEVLRYFANLAAWDRYLASSVSLACTSEQLFQGPLADALTHVGQLAMLRRVAGAPVRGENYFKADIIAGRVGLEQSPARREFD